MSEVARARLRGALRASGKNFGLGSEGEDKTLEGWTRELQGWLRFLGRFFWILAEQNGGDEGWWVEAGESAAVS